MKLKRNQRQKFLKLTIAEAFPVLAPIGDEPRCGQGKGPFFAPGSTWHYPMHELDHVERMATHLRSLGYTVTVAH
jgi:hypothetical protein